TVPVATDAGLAFDGSGSVITVKNDVQSFITGAVTTPQNVLVDAADETRLLVIAGGLAYGATAAAGVSGSSTTVERTVKAYLGAGAVVTALGHGDAVADPEGEGFSGNGLLVHATSNDTTTVIAVAGHGSETAAFAVSLADNKISGRTAAYLGDGA